MRIIEGDAGREDITGTILYNAVIMSVRKAEPDATIIGCDIASHNPAILPDRDPDPVLGLLFMFHGQGENANTLGLSADLGDPGGHVLSDVRLLKDPASHNNCIHKVRADLAYPELLPTGQVDNRLITIELPILISKNGSFRFTGQDCQVKCLFPILCHGKAVHKSGTGNAKQFRQGKSTKAGGTADELIKLDVNFQKNSTLYKDPGAETGILAISWGSIRMPVILLLCGYYGCRQSPYISAPKKNGVREIWNYSTRW